MPLAIMLDLTPFVQILLLLWNFGFVMNQVLTKACDNKDLTRQGIVNALMRDAPASLQVIFDARRLARGLASGSTFPRTKPCRT